MPRFDSTPIGSRFGRLVLVEVLGTVDRNRQWKCRCDCGKEVVRLMNNIKRGITLSCGCLGYENVKSVRRTHGDACRNAVSREFQTWQRMIQRCHNPKVPCFRDYGGRGIAVCDRWRKSFDAFLSDMGRRPPGNFSIDRIDVDGNYEPSNCRWATPKQQANNKRRHKQAGTEMLP